MSFCPSCADPRGVDGRCGCVETSHLHRGVSRELDQNDITDARYQAWAERELEKPKPSVCRPGVDLTSSQIDQIRASVQRDRGR